MKCFEYYRKGKHTILPTMAAVRKGFDVQGVEWDKSYHAGEKYDFALCWGWRQDESLSEFWSGPRLYVEMGYIHARTANFRNPAEYCAARCGTISFCWDGCHGSSRNYAPDPAPSDRFDALGVEIKPWRRNPAGDVVILGQTEFDPVAVPAGRTTAWNQGLIAPAEAVFGAGRVRYRPHPRYTDFKDRPLLVDCRGARRVITYSSTAAVETVLAGIPTQVLSKRSIAWPVACHTFEEPEFTPDREQWAHQLAYRQWTLPEIESGEFWDTVKRGL